MEGQKYITLSVTYSSSVCQSLKMDFYDCDDLLIASQILQNYRETILRIRTTRIRFYCLLWLRENFSREFEIQLPAQVSGSRKFYVEKRYEDLTIKMQMQVADCFEAVFEQCPQLSRIENYASQYLRRMEQTVMKKLSIEEFKRSIKSKPDAGKEMRGRKGKKNLTAILSSKQGMMKRSSGFRNIATMEGFPVLRGQRKGGFDEGLADANSSMLSTYGDNKEKGVNDKVFRKKETRQSIQLRQEKEEQPRFGGAVGRGCPVIATNNFRKIRKRVLQQRLWTETSDDLQRQKETLQFARCFIDGTPRYRGKPKALQSINNQTASPYKQPVGSTTHRRIF